MNESRHARLGALFESALAVPREERRAFIDAACGGDSELRAELRSLLDAHDSAGAYFENLGESIVTPAFASVAESSEKTMYERLREQLATALMGRYDIQGELSGGGMSRVFLAEELKLKRKVVIKVLPPELTESVSAARFQREIQLAAQLLHPHIVPLLTADASDSLLYYTMPYVVGESLRARLDREGALPVAESLNIWRDMLDALALAHGSGVVHRDIKPGNILLGGRNALITDFGIARAIETAASGTDSTATGLVIGTPAYMAPEQASGDRDADSGVDIYAAGLVMYEMLVGHQPFPNLSPREVMLAHLTREPPPINRPDVSSELASLVLQCLAKDPARRPSDAEAILSAIDGLTMRELTRGGEPPVVPISARRVRIDWSRRHSTLATAAILIAAVSAAVFFGLRSRPARNLHTNSVAVIPPLIIGQDSALVIFAEAVTDLLAIALDGNGVPTAADQGATLAAWRRPPAHNGGPFDRARAAARAVGADAAILTDVSEATGGQLHFTARIVSTDNGAVRARADFVGDRTDPLRVAHRLLAELLARQAGEEEERLTDLTSKSLPAVVDFLRGRAQRRRSQTDSALSSLDHALAQDSSFALAALEYASTTGWLLRFMNGNEAKALGFLPSPQGEQETARWQRALRLARRGAGKFSSRDRALLEAVAGPRFPEPSSAREMIQAWANVVRIAPDRADGHYSLAYLLLFQGEVVGLTDSRAWAKASFNRSLEIDSSFTGSLLGLLELAGFERDTTEVRRLAALYLLRDSLGPQADYVRWRVASLGRDERELARLRSRFASLDESTLAQILYMSQMDDIEVDDADRADAALLRRASDRATRADVLWGAFFVALNRGRPKAAQELLDQSFAVRADVEGGRRLRERAALFGDGDEAAGERAVREIEGCLRKPSAADTANRSRCGPYPDFSVILWRLWHGDTTGAVKAIAKLRSVMMTRGNPAAPLLFNQVSLLDALLASLTGRADSRIALARLDSIALLGCCIAPHFINLVSARLHERYGDLSAALAAVRRGEWFSFFPEWLATYVREEGRLAALAGDRAGAIRAYHHYLSLRASPEPALQPQRNKIRAIVAQLESGR